MLASEELSHANKNIDWRGIASGLGYPPGALPVIKQHTHRMHEGSHHLLLYAYLGPQDSRRMIPIGGTQVAGTRYEVKYPAGVGSPILTEDTVPVTNIHYTNPFPATSARPAGSTPRATCADGRHSAGRSVLVMTSCTSSTLGPANISAGGRFLCASAKSALRVQATKSSKLRHQVFTS